MRCNQSVALHVQYSVCSDRLFLSSAPSRKHGQSARCVLYTHVHSKTRGQIFQSQPESTTTMLKVHPSVVMHVFRTSGITRAALAYTLGVVFHSTRNYYSATRRCRHAQHVLTWPAKVRSRRPHGSARWVSYRYRTWRVLTRRNTKAPTV